MSTSTATLTDPASPPSRLISSTSSLGSQSPSSPSVTRAFKQANQLFLTRQISESLDVLELLFEQSPPSSDSADNESGHDSRVPQPAPIASASRTARIRVWSLYISILNEICQLDPETGKATFGAARWKALVSKAHDAEIWEEVVQVGFSGVEGSVDADIVINLATLLLAQSPSQKLTQQRLETYLATSNTPNLDVESHLQHKYSKSQSQPQPNGTSTPRDLGTRVKLLEIYTLHVLPRNQEWEYAREFIGMSEILDEDKKDAFLHALQSLQDEKDLDSRRETELQKQRDQQLEDARKRDSETRKAQKAKNGRDQKQEQGSQNSNTIERDFGLDRSHTSGASKSIAKPSANGVPPSGRPNSTSKPSAPSSGSHSKPPPGSKSRALTSRRGAAALFDAGQKAFIALVQRLKKHPLVFLRMLAFLVAILMAVGQRDVRERLRRIRDASWDKVKQTVGMGIKVSYI